MAPSSESIHVGLVFVHGFANYRRALRGVWRYVEARPQWQLTSIAPEQHSLRMPRRFRPDGLIVALNTTSLQRALSAWRRPAVNVSAVFSSQPFPRVGVDNRQTGRLAADHFLERGLRHFAFVGPPRHLFSTERREAFCQAVQEAGYVAECYDDPRKLEFDPLGHRWDFDAKAQQWLQKLPKPVGVFTPNDLWGVQVVLACRSAELRVPDDVAVLGVDDDDLYCELTRPRLSSIVVPAEQIGFEAVALLERLLAGKKPPDQPILLPPAGVNTRRSSEVLIIDDPEVAAAVRYIRECGHEPLRVVDVVRHVSLGRRSLERRCRAALGWGVAEEIRRAHLQRACRLLSCSDLPMQAVALQAGYSEYRQLARTFRTRLGMTPTNYRRLMHSASRHDDQFDSSRRDA